MVLIAVRCPSCQNDQIIKGGKTETGTLNLSHFVAHKIWRRRGIFPLRCRAYRL